LLKLFKALFSTGIIVGAFKKEIIYLSDTKILKIICSNSKFLQVKLDLRKINTRIAESNCSMKLIIWQMIQTAKIAFALNFLNKYLQVYIKKLLVITTNIVIIYCTRNII